MASRAAKLCMSEMCESVRGVAVTSHRPVRLVRLSCLAHSTDPYKFCSQTISELISRTPRRTEDSKCLRLYMYLFCITNKMHLFTGQRKH